MDDTDHNLYLRVTQSMYQVKGGWSQHPSLSLTNDLDSCCQPRGFVFHITRITNEWRVIHDSGAGLNDFTMLS